MTLQELYQSVEGDYEQALRVLRIEKLIDKHICKFPSNLIFEDLNEAVKTMDGVKLFEASHAIKGVCANLGLTKISSLASKVCEEYRPGNQRQNSDDEIKDIIKEMNRLHDLTCVQIEAYASNK